MKRALPLSLATLYALGCGTRTDLLSLGPSNPSFDAGMDTGPSSPWIPDDHLCCDIFDLFITRHRGDNVCGQTLERDYLVGNCGRSTIEVSVAVEFWAGESPEDPNAVLLQSAGTTPGMPGQSAEWIEFSIPWANAAPHLNGALDAFVLVDGPNAVAECGDEDGTDAPNMLFDSVRCP